jgi:hypothetical protein
MRRRLTGALRWPVASERWGRLTAFLAWVGACWLYFHVTGAELGNDRPLLAGLLACLALIVVGQVALTRGWDWFGLGLLGLILGFLALLGSFVPRLFADERAPGWVGVTYRAFLAAAVPLLAVGFAVLAWQEWRARRRRRGGGP